MPLYRMWVFRGRKASRYSTLCCWISGLAPRAATSAHSYPHTIHARRPLAACFLHTGCLALFNRVQGVDHCEIGALSANQGGPATRLLRWSLDVIDKPQTARKPCQPRGHLQDFNMKPLPGPTGPTDRVQPRIPGCHRCSPRQTCNL